MRNSPRSRWRPYVDWALPFVLPDGIDNTPSLPAVAQEDVQHIGQRLGLPDDFPHFTESFSITVRLDT